MPAAPVVAVLVAVAAVALVPAAPASAHTDLTGTSVDAGTLAADAGEVVLRFRGGVRAELSTVVVRGPDGRDRGQGRLRVRDGDVVRSLTAPLAPGTFTLAYRVLAADGHPLTGTRSFRVVAAGPGADPASAAPTAPSVLPEPSGNAQAGSGLREGPGERRLEAGLAVGGLLAAAALAAAALHRRRGRP